MPIEISALEPLSSFARYLANFNNSTSKSLPALNDLSKSLDISIASLREQLEVTRALGLVDVKPRKGIRKLPYSFYPAVRLSLAYILEAELNEFEKFADLRKHIEETYWFEAVGKLTSEDISYLNSLVNNAFVKLEGTPIKIPHQEHKELHLTIYKRLDNGFVMGLLEAYWYAYESIGLNVYTGLTYLKEVWQYHREIVNSISQGNFHQGYKILIDHTDLLYHRPGERIPKDITAIQE